MKTFTKFLVILCVCFYIQSFFYESKAQIPFLINENTFGGNQWDEIERVIPLPDGGLLIAGYSSSDASGEKTEDSRGLADYWVIRVDEDLNLVWDKTFGGDSFDFLEAMVATQDGGFLLGGYSNSSISGERSAQSRGMVDFWLVKIDKDGNQIWDKAYGGAGNDYLLNLLALPNEEFLLIGESESMAGGDKSEDVHGGSDSWIIKVDAKGDKIWDKNYGGTLDDKFLHGIRLTDGGFLLGGFSNSNTSFDKSDDSRGGDDFWLVRTDDQGNQLWDKTYGGNGIDRLGKIAQTSDQGFLLYGASASGISVDKSEESRGSRDLWLIKTNEEGDKLWDKTYGGSKDEFFGDFVMQPNGNLLLTGYSTSNISFEKSEDSKGSGDFWLLETDAEGTLLWDKSIGGAGFDEPHHLIIPTSNDIYIGGSSASDISGDKTKNNRGIEDFWIVHLKRSEINQDLKAFLVDAITDLPLREIKPNDVIDLSEIGTNFLTVELRGELRNDFESVAIEIKGATQTQRIENLVPYTLFGKNTLSDFRGRNLKAGQYTLTATPYTQDKGQGDAGTTLEIPFTFVGEAPSPIKQFVLVNADTEQDIQIIQANDVIDLDQIGANRLSIRAETQGTDAGSVFLELENEDFSHTKTENFAPYALFGDESGTDYFGREFCPGDYSIKATSYTDKNLNGTEGNSYQVSFEIRRDGIEGITLIDANSNKDIGPLEDGAVELATGFSIRVDASNCVESVLFRLKDFRGSIISSRIENIEPFALLGDDPKGEYKPWFPPYTGSYSLELFTFSEDQGIGKVFGSQTIHFEIKKDEKPCVGELCDSLTVLEYSLLDPTTMVKFGTLLEGQVIDLDTLPNGFIVQAEVPTAVKSMWFRFVSPARGRQDQLSPPYQFRFFPFDKDDVELTLVPFSESNLRGLRGDTSKINFKLIGGTVSKPEKNINLQVFPNPSSHEQIHLDLITDWQEGDWGRLKVFDKQGRLWIEKEISSPELDLDIHLLEPGFYIIHVQTPKGTSRKVFIKQ